MTELWQVRTGGHTVHPRDVGRVAWGRTIETQSSCHIQKFPHLSMALIILGKLLFPQIHCNLLKNKDCLNLMSQHLESGPIMGQQPSIVIE